MTGGDPLGPHRSTPAELKERIEVERRGEPFLVLRDSVGAQRIVALAPASVALSVGRDAGADIRLEWDGRVSRLHATLERAGAAWTVADEGLSRNGTFVNQERVAGRRRLYSGDVVRIGNTEIVYLDSRGENDRETSMAEEAVLQAELSQMQRRVLSALCRPLRDHGPYASPATNPEIADEVHLSVAAVKTHLRTLFAKFVLTDLPQNRKRAALAEAALRSGVLTDLDFETGKRD